MEEFLLNLQKKFGYSEELKEVIKMTIALMVDEYGQENITSIYNFFNDVKIFLTNDMSQQNLEEIKNKYVPKDKRIIEEENNIYGNDNTPGSVYNYETIYDEKMNPIGEYRWIVVEDLKGNYREEKYRETFKTSINMPYFLHEINHAFNMQRPIYKKTGNKVYVKHGIFEENFVLENKGSQVSISSENEKNILLEEAINEMQTQRMLCRYFNETDYTKVREKLNSMGHVSTSYDGTLIFLAEYFESLIGKDKLLEYRKDNNKSVIEEFNKTISQSKIAQHNNFAHNGFEKFGQLCFDVFQLKCECYKHSIEEYRQLMSKLTLESLGPLYAYSEVTKGNISLEEYESKKESFNQEQNQK